MQENIEIEYKHCLDEEGYLKIKEYLERQKDHVLIEQENYYFETKDFSLKDLGYALRIRVIDNNEYELCLKKQRENDILEKNIMVSKEEFNEICLEPNLMREYINEDYDFILLGSLNNKRIEYRNENGLICLDKSSYFDKIDYELEYEANDYDSESYLAKFLSYFEITYVSNKKSKIQRFIEAYNNK